MSQGLREYIDQLVSDGFTVTDVHGEDPYLLDPMGKAVETWPAPKEHDWYDVTVALPGMEVRLAGRIERGTHGISDPLTSA